jgi:sugar lactone lactonase YvrE
MVLQKKLIATLLIIAILITAAGVLWYKLFFKKFEFSFTPEKKTKFNQKPYFLGEVNLKKGRIKLIPGALFYEKGKLYVFFLNSPHTEVFDLKKEEKETINFSSAPLISSFTADKKSFYFIDRKTQEIVFAEKKRLKEERYGLLPERKGRLDPIGIYWYEGNIYVSDNNLKAVLIISTENKGKLKERGELLLTAPSFFKPQDEKYKLSSPGDVLVTPDGRIMVADGEKVMVYTCNGNFAYLFPEEKNLKEAVDIDYDMVFQPKPPPNPRLSQNILKQMGRIHILDKKAGEVVVYNPYADKRLFTYGKEEGLKEPISIAIARDLRLIFISDTGNRRIVVYGY